MRPPPAAVVRPPRSRPSTRSRGAPSTRRRRCARPRNAASVLRHAPSAALELTQRPSSLHPTPVTRSSNRRRDPPRSLAAIRRPPPDAAALPPTTRRRRLRRPVRHRLVECRAEHPPPPAPSTHPLQRPQERCPEAAKFRHSPLADEDKMSEIFDHHSVTNEYARVPPPTSQVGPSQVNIVDDDAGSGCDGDPEVTPVVARGKKRSCPYSPSPRTSEKIASDSAFKAALERIVQIFERRETSKNSMTSQATVDPVRHEFKEMMAMVVDDGGLPGSDEHFYATQLFMKKKYRDAFSCLEDVEASVRLGWLKRTCEERKNN